jgi:hypothetical protein
MDIRPYIKTIHVVSSRVARDFEIELGDAFAPRPTHLILTGPNGSGKSSIVEGLGINALNYKYAFGRPQNPPDYMRDNTPFIWVDAVIENEVANKPRLNNADFLCLLSARRQWKPAQPAGPNKLSFNVDAARASSLLQNHFLQYLVNRRMDQALAREDGDHAAADATAAWFERFEQAVADLFEIPHLKLHFDRGNYLFTLELVEGQQSRFDQLPDGFSSILSIWSELILREESWRKLNPGQEPVGIVLIDEIEAHLHIELQAKVLGFFTTLYPKLQFIVTTHSPVVLSCIPNAVIYDLGSHERVESRELQGLRFGSIMTGHLGMEQDFDQDSAAELTELRKLVAEGGDKARIEELSNALSSRSHTLSTEVWRLLSYPKPAAKP